MGVLDPLSKYVPRVTPQTSQARADQVVNNADGFVFAVDDLTRLRRFLTLGVEGGTYYVTERELTKDNASIIVKLAGSDPKLVVDEVVSISVAGRAPRQNPALFALAAVAGLADNDGRTYAIAQLSKVARTGTHLALFTKYVQQFRGWGRALRRGISDWYLEKTPDALAYQVLKYRSREGWTHRDLLRKAHPIAKEPTTAKLFDYITHSAKTAAGDIAYDLAGLPDLVAAYEEAKTAPTSRLVELIGAYRLSWEMLPNEALDSAAVWEALLDQGMPITALMRQLPRLTRMGVLTSDRRNAVASRLSDPAVLTKGRVHPISVLVALRTYAAGRSARGANSWRPIARIVDALDAAFYASFDSITPTGKRTLLALDVSGSMTSPISGMPLTAREASAAMALVTAKIEPDHEILGFTSQGRETMVRTSDRRGQFFVSDSAVSQLAISPRQRLDDAIKTVSDMPFSGTDCALPMLWALNRKMEVDTFVIYTDSETWHGDIHPFEALRSYREQMGVPAKLVVVGMTATNFSIADPLDAGMLDVAGFDAAVPSVIADFSAAPMRQS